MSWYEAAAYANFAGKSLPTIYHWSRAAGNGGGSDIFPDVLNLSNFAGSGPAAVGSHRGIGPFGNYDMAGNVREWCANETGGRGSSSEVPPRTPPMSSGITTSSPRSSETR